MKDYCYIIVSTMTALKNNIKNKKDKNTHIVHILLNYSKMHIIKPLSKKRLTYKVINNNNMVNEFIKIYLTYI